MTTLLEVGLGDGRTVLLEVEGEAGGPALRGGKSVGTTVVEAGKTLDAVLGDLGSMTRAMVKRLRAVEDAPHEIEVEFNVKLTAEANVVIARTGGEANFRVAMRWSPELAKGA